MLSQRTGLKPNLTCRLGFCLSLEEAGLPTTEEFGGRGAREFNWSTLFGQWDTLFVALLKQRLHQDGLDPESDLEEQLTLHLNRGVFLLFKRMRELEDLGSLLDRAGTQTLAMKGDVGS
jgi:DNA sulfur modification protein DndE